jgi:hypothetical protein
MIKKNKQKLRKMLKHGQIDKVLYNTLMAGKQVKFEKPKEVFNPKPHPLAVAIRKAINETNRQRV